MKIRALVMVLGASLLIVINQACLASESRPKVTLTPTIPDPHNHVGDINNNSLGPQNAADFKLVESFVEPNAASENIAVNQQGTLRAFSLCERDCEIFIEDLETNRTYQLEAPSFLSTRPFSDLVWIANDILIFDQWTQPHYGVHYAVDVVNRELILASPFTDQAP